MDDSGLLRGSIEAFSRSSASQALPKKARDTECSAGFQICGNSATPQKSEVYSPRETLKAQLEAWCITIRLVQK